MSDKGYPKRQSDGSDVNRYSHMMIPEYSGGNLCYNIVVIFNAESFEYTVIIGTGKGAISDSRAAEQHSL